MQPENEYDMTFSVQDGASGFVHIAAMMGTQELLAVVRPLATNAELARLLKLSPARITELYKGDRKLQLEEAKTLVEHFNLEGPGLAISQTSLPVAKMAVLHIAHGVGIADPDDDAVEDLARDLLAFASCALDPQWKGQIDALAQMLQGIEARRRAEKASG